MTVAKAIREINITQNIENDLDEQLKKLEQNDYADLTISKTMAFQIMDICQAYRDMLKGEEVNIKYDLKGE